MESELCYLTAVNAIQQFRTKTLSPVELMEAMIARAEAVEPHINAFSFTYYEEALAGDPGGAVLLMAMGFDVLSMNATTLLKVKAVIRSMTLSASQSLLNQVMVMDDAQMVRSCVDMALYNAGVDRLLRSSRTN